MFSHPPIPVLINAEDEEGKLNAKVDEQFKGLRKASLTTNQKKMLNVFLLLGERVGCTKLEPVVIMG